VRLAEALREQGAEPDELAALLPAVRRLAEWQAPQPSPADTQRLIAHLADALPAPAPTPASSLAVSPIRQSIRAERQRQGYGLRWLLAVARAQVSLFGPAFWVMSALITFVGAIAVLGINQEQSAGGLIAQALLLRASGPLLAYLGAIVAFRGARERALECELVCLPSPLQLAIARLVIVLGYDVGLGLVLSLALWAGGSDQVFALTLSWFTPLLLVAGLALLLSLRLSVQTAAAVAYVGWLAALAIGANIPLYRLPLAALPDALIGGAGMLLLAVALARLQSNIYRLFPSS
jgi:hypothetical protein